MRATFQNTVDILVKAYLNGTLVKMNCFACAVGNIVAANCGYTYKSKHLVWAETNDFSWFGDIRIGRNGEQVVSTGYTTDQLMSIEKAFEQSPAVDGDIILGGLLAVVDVLAEIHSIDLTEKESAKALFVKA